MPRYLRLSLFILFLLSCYCTNAQVVSGVVTAAGSGKALYPVTVVNLTTQKSVYTAEDGSFSITAKTGDRLVFTLVGYSTAEQPITTDVLLTRLSIQLITYSYQLNEFILRPNYTPYQSDSLHRRAVYARTLAWKRSSSIMSPVSFLADRISGKSKTRYAFQKNYNRWEDEKYVDTRYTADLVTQLTGLKGDSVGHFMNAYPMDFDYARNATELELKMWIRFHYKQWLANPVMPVTDSTIANRKQ